MACYYYCYYIFAQSLTTLTLCTASTFDKNVIAITRHHLFCSLPYTYNCTYTHLYSMEVKAYSVRITGKRYVCGLVLATSVFIASM